MLYTYFSCVNRAKLKVCVWSIVNHSGKVCFNNKDLSRIGAHALLMLSPTMREKWLTHLMARWTRVLPTDKMDG